MEMRKFIVEIQRGGTVKAVEYCDEDSRKMTLEEWNKYLIRAGCGFVVAAGYGEFSDEYMRGYMRGYKEALSSFVCFLGKNYSTIFK